MGNVNPGPLVQPQGAAPSSGPAMSDTSQTVQQRSSGGNTAGVEGNGLPVARQTAKTLTEEDVRAIMQEVMRREEKEDRLKITAPVKV